LQITVIIPTYNEAENMPRMISALFSLPLPELKLLVVDDNSPDHTGQIVEDLASQHPGHISVLHRPGKMGLGAAYIAGFQRALADGAEAMCQMDADFSHPPEKLVELAETLKTCDIAVGSRYVRGGRLDEHWPLWRKGLSAWANFYARTILGISQRDVTGGYRLFRREAILRLPLERICSSGYVFQVELAYLAHLLGLFSKEIPIYFAERRWGASKMSLRIQLEAALRVWQLLGTYRDLKKKRKSLL
jgi:dolichol-phosphate mannosyltransferase